MSTVRNQYIGIFQKNKKCFYFNNFGLMWLVNELVLSIWIFKKSAKFQSNLIIISKVIVFTYAGQTFSLKTLFLTQAISKSKDLMKI